jgi:hypothetical protein
MAGGPPSPSHFTGNPPCSRADPSTSTARAPAKSAAARSPRSSVSRVKLMAPAQLSDLTGRLASIWIADLNHPDGRPDRGLALIDASVIETVPVPETFGLHGSPSHPNATGTTRP